MNGNNEPDVIRLSRPVIDEREDGYYLYFHDLPPVLIENPIRFSPEDLEDTPPDPDA